MKKMELSSGKTLHIRYLLPIGYLSSGVMGIYLFMIRSDFPRQDMFKTDIIDFTILIKLIFLGFYIYMGYHVFHLWKGKKVFIDDKHLYISDRKRIAKINRTDIVDVAVSYSGLPTIKIYFNQSTCFGNYIEFQPFFIKSSMNWPSSVRIEPDLLKFLQGKISFEDFFERNT